MLQTHHVYNQVIGPLEAPYAQRLKLGWVIVGETCLDKQNAPQDFNVKKTFISSETTMTIQAPCAEKFKSQKQDTDLAFTSPGHFGLLSDQPIGSQQDLTTECESKLELSTHNQVSTNDMNQITVLDKNYVGTSLEKHSIYSLLQSAPTSDQKIVIDSLLYTYNQPTLHCMDKQKTVDLAELQYSDLNENCSADLHSPNIEIVAKDRQTLLLTAKANKPPHKD